MLLFPGDESRSRIVIDGAVPQNGAPIVRSNHVATDFFAAFGVRVITGRALRDSDATAAGLRIQPTEALRAE